MRIVRSRRRARLCQRPCGPVANGLEEVPSRHGRPDARPPAVRLHDRLPLHLRAHQHRARADGGAVGAALLQERDPGPQGRLELLDQALHDDVRHRGRHRHHDGVRLRHQLGGLLALRGQHLRRAAGGRRPVRLLPRVDLPGRSALRPQEGIAWPLLRLHLARLDRRLALGAVDPHRQLLAADAARATRWWTARPSSPTSGPRRSTPRRRRATCTPWRRRSSPAASWLPASRRGTC